MNSRNLTIVLVIMLLLAGCGIINKAKNDDKAVQQGGQIVYGSLQQPDTLNPVLSDTFAVSEAGRLIFSGLLLINEKGEWQPDLALDVPAVKNGGVSEDGLTVTYKIRSGVTWHDGVPFSADDVRFTWQFIIHAAAPVVRREGYDTIAAIDTPDANTVIIHFKEYYAPYLSLFSTILPRHVLDTGSISLEEFGKTPVGTGPYRVKEWQYGNAIVFEANTNYFRGRPVLDTIVYKFINDSSELLSYLQAGQLDIVSNISAGQLEQVRAVEGYKTIMTPNLIWERMDFNLDYELFQDMRVRKAVLLGIDRQAIIDQYMRNLASPAAGDQSPLSWAYNPAMTVTARDVSTARELLVQAGWRQGADGIFEKDGRKLAFSLVTTAGDKTRENIAGMIAAQLQEVGVAVEVRFVTAQTLFGDALKKRRFETAMYALVAGLDPDDYALWNSQSIPAADNGYTGQNFAGWRNDEVDRLTDAGRQTLDLDKRKLYYFQIQELLQQEVPVLPLYFRTNIDLAKSSIVKYRPNPCPYGNLWNAWEIAVRQPAEK